MTPKVLAICEAGHESDMIRLAVTHAAGFCHRIHFVDHASTDGTWEIVQDLARDVPYLLPLAQRSGDWRRGIHAHFMVTQADVSTPCSNREGGEIRAFYELTRHSRFGWVETRLFRNAPVLEWPEFTPDGRVSRRYLPMGPGRAFPHELPNRHDPHRSRKQLQGRLRLHAEERRRDDGLLRRAG